MTWINILWQNTVCWCILLQHNNVCHCVLLQRELKDERMTDAWTFCCYFVRTGVPLKLYEVFIRCVAIANKTLWILTFIERLPASMGARLGFRFYAHFIFRAGRGEENKKNTSSICLFMLAVKWVTVWKLCATIHMPHQTEKTH